MNCVIIIAGPTAVGKTALSLQLAQHFNTAIISADSRQCFRELNIGVAKPEPQELALAPHYFINSHSIQEEVNAAVFEQYALDAAASVFTHNPVAVMVGGTGLYIKAFCEGLDNIPPVPDEIHEQVVAQYQQHGLEWLQQQLQEKDPEFWAVAEQQNPQRLMRALEVWNATGASIHSFRVGKKEQRSFAVIKIGLELDRPVLYQRINARVDIMMQQGLLAEATELYPQKHLNALQTVGYREFFDYLDGKTTLPQAVELLKQNTRHYAKRQMTWFKKDAAVQWFHPADSEAVIAYVTTMLAQL
ncbi:tRNA dimethylallyltransferase [Filimonas lacunae]|uniref:tRNA dimethylallyltransferase n=1 Tax=Filimonas lacunae TaxID=477680 RepID=A0A173ML42_9BACT|nr:tRNA (adenosine(37)-N6)-dimethylallyltransferase MiaA [Filimonas lacunae]BAV08189.1 tRNA dimethylallyltransferase [Filimonas lacunae]SIT10562.1 tRNA dimethylallyltransferase [Filimonas lacunae]